MLISSHFVFPEVIAPRLRSPNRLRATWDGFHKHTTRPRRGRIEQFLAENGLTLALVGRAAIQTGVVGLIHHVNHAAHSGLIPFSQCLDAYAMILLAVFNRYVLTPRLKADAGALAAFRATSLTEVAPGTVVVALVSFFAPA